MESDSSFSTLDYSRATLDRIGEAPQIDRRSAPDRHRCLARPASLPHPAGIAASPGRHRCLTRPASRLHPAGIAASPGRHRCLTRPASLPRPAGIASSPGRHRCLARPASLPHPAGIAASPGRHSGFTRPASLPQPDYLPGADVIFIDFQHQRLSSSFTVHVTSFIRMKTSLMDLLKKNWSHCRRSSSHQQQEQWHHWPQQGQHQHQQREVGSNSSSQTAGAADFLD